VARIVHTAPSMEQHTPATLPASGRNDQPSQEGQNGSAFPIGELTRRTGTTKRVVEHAEAKGLLQPAARTAAGHKLYSSREEETLRLIVRLYELGFSANRIKALFSDPAERVDALFDEHHRFLQGRVEEARRRVGTFERERAAVRRAVESHRAERPPDSDSDSGTAPARARRSQRSSNDGVIAPQPERLPGRHVDEAA
jgi:DNA-binding transcriptional MerR regulator